MNCNDVNSMEAMEKKCRTLEKHGEKIWGGDTKSATHLSDSQEEQKNCGRRKREGFDCGVGGDAGGGRA